MRLFLASQNLEGYSEKLVELVGANKRMIYIGNAKDDWSPADRAAKSEDHKKEFSALGFDFNEVDLRDYFDKSADLQKVIDGAGLLWMSGGNTFLLNYAVRKSGLDKLLLKKLGRDELVLGGSSAGSIMATPSLLGADWEQDRENAKEIYGEIIEEGLNLVPFYIVPHYKSGWADEEAEAMVEALNKEGVKYETLRDGQVVLMSGSQVEVLK